MPKYAKGSEEMKKHMSHLRSLRKTKSSHNVVESKFKIIDSFKFGASLFDWCLRLCQCFPLAITTKSAAVYRKFLTQPQRGVIS